METLVWNTTIGTKAGCSRPGSTRHWCGRSADWNWNRCANGIDPDKDVTIEYYSEATEVTAQMANTEDAIAVLPQPYVTAAGLQDDTLRVALDLTEEWNKVADTQLITGVTVVRKEYAEEHPDVVAAFLTDYAKSVEAANADLDGTACKTFSTVKILSRSDSSKPYSDKIFIS